MHQRNIGRQGTWGCTTLQISRNYWFAVCVWQHGPTYLCKLAIAEGREACDTGSPARDWMWSPEVAQGGGGLTSQQWRVWGCVGRVEVAPGATVRWQGSDRRKQMWPWWEWLLIGIAELWLSDQQHAREGDRHRKMEDGRREKERETERERERKREDGSETWWHAKASHGPRAGWK